MRTTDPETQLKLHYNTTGICARGDRSTNFHPTLLWQCVEFEIDSRGGHDAELFRVRKRNLQLLANTCTMKVSLPAFRGQVGDIASCTLCRRVILQVFWMM